MTDQPPQYPGVFGTPGGSYEYKDGQTPPEIRVGEFYAARTFSVDPDGWLTGMVFHQPWLPGANKAKCWRARRWRDSNGNLYTSALAQRVTDEDVARRELDANPELSSLPSLYWVVTDESGEEHKLWSRPEPVFWHDLTDDHTPAGCVCGWHAYLAGSLNFANHTKAINAVVKAWGTVVVHSRGIRAQYAEVAALALNSAGDLDQSNAVYAPLTMQIPVPPAVAGLFARKTLVTDELDKVRGRYPNVPVFNSLDAMLREFPLTPVEKGGEGDE